MNSRQRFFALVGIAVASSASSQEYLGQFSENPFAPNSTSNPYAAGSTHNQKSVTNRYGVYGSPYSNKSATNPYATDAPKLYDSDGNYRGKLSSNPNDPESVSNPYGRYGSKYSAESVNNPYAAGSKYGSDSPNNPYGKGLSVYGQSEKSPSVKSFYTPVSPSSDAPTFEEPATQSYRQRPAPLGVPKLDGYQNQYSAPAVPRYSLPANQSYKPYRPNEQYGQAE